MCKRYFFILFVLKICTFRFANYILHIVAILFVDIVIVFVMLRISMQ